MAVTKINEFMKKIGVQGGMSLSSGFDVEFDFSGKDASFIKNYANDKDLVTMLCDEAQLPNVQSGTAQITGRHLGEGPISYPHTRIFTDLSLGFLLDANTIPLKFFNSWYNYIFGETEVAHDGTIDGARAMNPLPTNRVNRLQYPSQYTCTAKIIKTEPSAKGSNHRAPLMYMLENCYPYSIDAVPLAYGSSQVTRLTVNLYYTRHTVSYGTKIDQSIDKEKSDTKKTVYNIGKETHTVEGAKTVGRRTSF